MNQESVVQYDYENNVIPFTKNGYVNATEMAKPFKKRTSNFLRLDATKEYIEALKVRYSDPSNGIVTVLQGGNPELQGTWLHPKMALRFAQWLNPHFAVWVDGKIEDLLTKGVAYRVNNDEALILVKAIEIKDRILAEKEQLLIEAKPKIDVYNKFIKSKFAYTSRQVATSLGYGIVTFNRELVKHKMIYKMKEGYYPYNYYLKNGFIGTTQTAYINKYGVPGSASRISFSSKGVVKVSEKLDKPIPYELLSGKIPETYIKSHKKQFTEQGVL